jgi:hypothetical protein
MPAAAEASPGEVPRVARRQRMRRVADYIRARWRFLVTQSSSSLTRRIVLLNLAGLLALVISILYLSQYRAGLIDARVQSLLVQGEIIASAIAASATVEVACSPRFWRRWVKRSPGWRHPSPTVGSSSPVTMRKSVVFPTPFLPTIPQRSPRAT